MDERSCLLAMRLVPGIGARRGRALRDYFGSAQDAWHARDRWEEVPGIGPGIVHAARRVDPGVIERHRRLLETYGVQVLIDSDPDYPPGLRHIPAPPPVLFVRGRLPPAARPALAIVGTRRASAYGLRTARSLARDLAAVGVVIVSGLARGIDAAAHRGALDGKGATVAVLGCGLDIAYPPENRELMNAIAATGALVTEYPMGTRPVPGNFPARNRIIAGLSQGVLLVEGSRRSGAMHTVAMAAESGREVLAVPGDIERWGSDGPNHLLREGAALVRHAVDVLESMGWTHLELPQAGISAAAAGPDGDMAGLAGRLIACLQEGRSLTVDELAAALETPAESLIGAVMGLELAGSIVRQPGGRFALPLQGMAGHGIRAGQPRSASGLQPLARPL